MSLCRRELLRSIALTATTGAFMQATTQVARALVEQSDSTPLVWVSAGVNHQNFLTLLGLPNAGLGELVSGTLNLTIYEPWLPVPSGDFSGALGAAPVLVIENLEPFLSAEFSQWNGILSVARAAVFLGTDACYGGLQWDDEAVTRVEKLCEDAETPYLKLPGIPVPPHHLIGTLGHLAFLGFPEVDRYGRPVIYYGETLCSGCEWRWAWEAGEFAEVPGEPGCLLKIGCKGPWTHNSCATHRWNGGVNWCVGAGAPCTGCSEPGFPDHSGMGLYGQMPGDSLSPQATALGWVRSVGWGFLGLATAGVALRLLMEWLKPEGRRGAGEA